MRPPVATVATGTSARRALYALALLQALGTSFAWSVTTADMRHMGATYGLIGFSLAAFFVVRGSLSFVAGRYWGNGQRVSITWSLAVFGLAGLAMAAAGGPWTLLIGRLVQALAAGVYWTAVLSLVAAAGGGEGRVGVLAAFNAAVAAGSGIGSLVSGPLADHFGPPASFLAMAAVFTAASLFWHYRLSRALPVAAVGDGGSAGGRPRSVVLQVATVASLAGLVPALTALGMPLLVLERGGSYATIGLVTALSVAAGVVAQTLAGPSLRLGRRRGLAAALGVQGGLCLLVAASRSLAPAVTLFPLMALATGISGTLFVAWLYTVAEPDQQPAAVGIFRAAADGGQVLFLLGLGAMADRLGLAPLFVVTAVVMLALAVTFVSLRRAA